MEITNRSWTLMSDNLGSCPISSMFHSFDLSSVQSPSCVWLFATPWSVAHQASLSITNSQSLLELMSIKSAMPSNHLILVRFSSCLQSFPASGSFPVSQFFTSVLAFQLQQLVLPMNIQDWFPLGLTGLISLRSTGLSRVFSNTTVQKHQFFGAQLSFFLFIYLFLIYFNWRLITV